MSRVFDIDLAIPSSYTLNLQSLTQRSFSVGLLARAAGIFGVDNIFVYHDPIYHDPEIEKQVIKILRYLAAPPYLKKSVFKRDRDLAYVGMLPPLTLDSHKKWIAIKDLKYPEYRIGYVLGRKAGRYIVDVGLDKFVAIRETPRSSIVFVEIIKSTSKYLIGRLLSRDECKEKDFYPGYSVRRLRVNLISFLDKYSGCKICLTRYGEYIGERYSDIKDEIYSTYERIILLLGSYEYGLDRIFEYYNLSLDDVCDYKINLVYKQRVETIRVEDAAMIGLSIFDLMRHSK